MVRNYLALNYFANHKRSGRASEVVSSQLSFFLFFFFFPSLKTRNWYSRWRNESKTEKKLVCRIQPRSRRRFICVGIVFATTFYFFFRRTWWHRRVDDVAAFPKRFTQYPMPFSLSPRLPGYDGAIKTVVILVCVSLSEGSISKCAKERRKNKKKRELNGSEYIWGRQDPGLRVTIK